MKKTLATILVMVVALILAGCSRVSTAPGEVAVIQDAGSMQNKVPVDCVAAGTNKSVDGNDISFSYIADPRSWDFTADKDRAESEPINVMTRDNVPLPVSGSMVFTLNTYCPVLVLFHTQFGLANQAFWQSTNTGVEDDAVGDAVGDNKGWRTVLDRFVKKQVQSAIISAFRKYNVSEVTTAPVENSATAAPDVAKNLETIEAEAATAIFNNLAETMGGQFFCQQNYVPTLPDADKPLEYKPDVVAKNPCQAPQLQIIPPKPPEAILNSAIQEQTARANLRRAEAEQDTREAELASEQKWIDAIGPCNWTLKYLADKGVLDKAPALVGCSGSNANILVNKATN